MPEQPDKHESCLFFNSTAVCRIYFCEYMLCYLFYCFIATGASAPLLKLSCTEAYCTIKPKVYLLNQYRLCTCSKSNGESRSYQVFFRLLTQAPDFLITRSLELDQVWKKFETRQWMRLFSRVRTVFHLWTTMRSLMVSHVSHLH